MKKAILLTLSILTFTASCRSNNVGNISQSTTDDKAPSNMLELPEVPSTLTAPAQRADYILLHFWDKMDFKNSEMMANDEFMGQTVANYVGIMPYSTESGRERAFDKLITEISDNPTALDRIHQLIELYLHGPESPMRDDRTYIIFADRMLQLPDLDLRTSELLKYEKRMASLNMTGNTVNNLPFITPEGSTSSIYDTKHDGLLVLLFYDPDCSTCEEYIKTLGEDRRINEMIERNELSVLALSAEGDEEQWKIAMSRIPRTWENGFIDEDARLTEIFDLRVIPSLYILDGNNTVILKDASIEKFLQQLDHL